MAEQCQHHLRTADGAIWPCSRVTAHQDGWHERVAIAPTLTEELVDVDYDRVERPAVGAVVVRWREKVPSDDPDSPNGLGAAW